MKQTSMDALTYSSNVLWKKEVKKELSYADPIEMRALLMMDNSPSSLSVGHETSNGFAKCQSRVPGEVLPLRHNCDLHNS